MNEEDIKQQMLQQKLVEQQQMKQVKEAVKPILAKALTKKARERLGNLKTVKPQLALQVEVYISRLYQAGQVGERITDQQLKQILKKVSEKKEINIKRK